MEATRAGSEDLVGTVNENLPPSCFCLSSWAPVHLQPALPALRFFFPRQPNNSIVLHLSRRAPVRRVSLSICKMNIFQVFNIYPSVSPLLRLPPLLHFPPLPHSQPWGHSIVNSLWFFRAAGAATTSRLIKSVKRQLIDSYFDSWSFVSVIFFKQTMSNICLSNVSIWPFFVIYDRKWRVFGFWTVGRHVWWLS